MSGPNIIQLSKGDNSSTTDEFSSHSDIEQSDIEPEDLVVEQLSDGRTKLRERKEGEHVVKINPNSEYARKMLSDFEIEELRAKQKIVDGSPDEPEDIDSVYQGMREDVEAHNREVARNKMKKEIESAREEMKEHTKYGTPVQELEGGEFQELIQEANGDGSPEPEGFEEVKKQIEEKYAPILEDNEPDINSPKPEELGEGIRAFREYGNPVFEELADDLEKSDSQTMYESVGSNAKRVTTSEEEMKNALRNHESEPFDGTVELEQDTGSTVVAVVSK